MKKENNRWEMFKYAVIEARTLFTTINAFDIFVTIRVKIGKAVFDLNPFCINLKSKIYDSKEVNLITGRRKLVDLKKL